MHDRRKEIIHDAVDMMLTRTRRDATQTQVGRSMSSVQKMLTLLCLDHGCATTMFLLSCMLCKVDTLKF